MKKLLLVVSMVLSFSFSVNAEFEEFLSCKFEDGSSLRVAIDDNEHFEYYLYRAMDGYEMTSVSDMFAFDDYGLNTDSEMTSMMIGGNDHNAEFSALVTVTWNKGSYDPLVDLAWYSDGHELFSDQCMLVMVDMDKPSER